MNYKELREQYGLSKMNVATMASRAGHKITIHILTKLEEGTPVRVGDDALRWLQYLYGVVQTEENWSEVPPGAYVFVLTDPKATYQFKSIDAKNVVCVFGGSKSRLKYRWFPASNVRVVSPTLLPEIVETLIPRTHTKNDERKTMIMAIVPEQGEISTRTISEELAYPLSVTSNVLGKLVADGKLAKVSRGVYRKA